MAKKMTLEHNGIDYSGMPNSKIGAQSLGKKFYFTGKRCANGHISPRYTSSGNCCECISQKRKKFIAHSEIPNKRVSSENIKRAEHALSMGFKTYEAVDNCKHGHSTRYVSSHNCVDCALLSSAKRYKKAKWKRIEKLYGITEFQYFEMLSHQLNKCKICSDAINENSTHIDHCHATGIVRGLLCGRCNQAIGLLRDSVEIINSAADYIKNATSRLPVKND